MDIEQINPSPSKFNTCKFRSENPITKTIKRCSCQGGDYVANGYMCYEKQIFQVTEEFCKNCEVYQSK